MSLKQAILSTATTKLVPVEAFGTTVYVKRLSVGEWAALERRLLALDKDAGSTEVAMHMVAATMCDESGERIFSDTELDKLADLPREDVLRVNAKAEELNRITPADVEQAAKN